MSIIASYTAPEFDKSTLVTIDVQRDVLEGQPLEVPGSSAAADGIGRLADCFRVAGRNNEDEGAIAAVNRTVLDRLQLGGEAFLSGTELRGRFTLRACIVNYRSTRQDIDRMLSAVRAIGRELADRSSAAL